MPSNIESGKTVSHQFWIRLALAIGLLLFAAAVLRAQQSDDTKTSSSHSAVSQPPALAGSWKLNRDESDDPRDKLRSAIQDREQNGTPGGMGRHGGMGGGGIGMGIPVSAVDRWALRAPVGRVQVRTTRKPACLR
jgi:hypothetical protein